MLFLHRPECFCRLTVQFTAPEQQSEAALFAAPAQLVVWLLDRTPRGTRTIEARHSSERRAQSALVATSERGCLFQADAVRERISMPMHELPFDPFTAINLCDPQRPVLLL